MSPKPVNRRAAAPRAAKPAAKPRVEESKGLAPRSRPKRDAEQRPERSEGLALAIACARAADDKLGGDTLILDLRGHRAVCDFFVVTTATSSPHLRAVDAAMQEAGEQLGSRLHHREGDPKSPWVLLDFFDVICHIFDAPTRTFYDLERLWADAKRVKWEQPKSAARAKKG